MIEKNVNNVKRGAKKCSFCGTFRDFGLEYNQEVAAQNCDFLKKR